MIKGQSFKKHGKKVAQTGRQNLNGGGEGGRPTWSRRTMSHQDGGAVPGRSLYKMGEGGAAKDLLIKLLAV